MEQLMHEIIPSKSNVFPLLDHTSLQVADIQHPFYGTPSVPNFRSFQQPKRTTIWNEWSFTPLCYMVHNRVKGTSSQRKQILLNMVFSRFRCPIDDGLPSQTKTNPPHFLGVKANTILHCKLFLSKCQFLYASY